MSLSINIDRDRGRVRIGNEDIEHITLRVDLEELDWFHELAAHLESEGVEIDLVDE